MNCIEEGTLRARIDKEIGAVDAEQVDQHLRACEICRQRSVEIAARSQQVSQLLGADAGVLDPVLAYSRYRQRTEERLENGSGWSKRWRGGWKHPAWAGVAAACLLIGLLSFAPARSWGQRILDMLRVQKIAVVPVEMSATGETGIGGPGKGLSQLISDSVIVTMKPGEPAAAPTLDAAGGMAGFNVRALDDLGTPGRILINGEAAFHMTLNRDRIEAVLDAAGRSDIQVPPSVDGSTVAVHIPKMARLLYGDCPAANRVKEIAADCITFIQGPSPTVSVPPELDIRALGEAGLQVVGMSAAEAHAFSQTVDWSSTLVIPIPQRGGSSRTVPVDGVNGTLVEGAARGKFPGSYTLVWVKNGIVYGLAGSGDANRALAAAGSLN